MKLLIIDCETTGLDPDQGAELIEIGAILFDVPTRSILAQVSTVLPVEKIGQEETHGISLQTANAVPFPVQSAAINLLSNMALNADYAVAHSAVFDQQFAPACIDIPWLCTYEDFNFAPYKKQKLTDLALAHGIAIKSAHRALTDCGLIAEILAKRDDLESLIDVAIARSLSPLVEIKALVDYKNRDKASKARFSWIDTTVKKGWFKTIKECDLDDIVGVDWERV
jgi:DNA polymerase-3 subunit epsilon